MNFMLFNLFSYTNSATNENSAGALQSFLINPNGTLSKAIDTISSGGDSPAFATALSTGAVAVMNYGSGNGRIIPTTSKGETFKESESTITFPPPIGGASHPHMALEYHNEIFVPDLVSICGLLQTFEY